MYHFSPPHHDSDTSRSPPFSTGARKNLAFNTSTPGSSVNENKAHLAASSQGLVALRNQSHQFAPLSAVSTATTTQATSMGRIPTSSITTGNPHILGENGVVIQGSGPLMGTNGIYPTGSVSSQFAPGTSFAVNSGEEGNSNLMWLLDFKLDFFNDPDSGRI